MRKNNFDETKAAESAKSAEKQLIALKNAQNQKINEVKEERAKMVLLRRTLSDLIYATSSGYKSVYPFAEGFIEGRIKSPDSIDIKTKNEITEILSQIEENPNINQEEILKKISEISFKDLFAFSVVTTKTPERFKTGSDEKNEELTKLSAELKIAKKRIIEHENFTSENKEQVINFTNSIVELRAKEQKLMSEEEKAQLIKEKTNEIIEKAKSSKGKDLEEFITKSVEDLVAITKEDSKESMQDKINEKYNLLNTFKKYVEYGNSNLSRTKAVMTKTLRDLQYKMSEFFVENLHKFSTFKFWGTTSIRKPKRMVKPGFRAVNTGYEVAFTVDKNDKVKIRFEAQGKGGLDYNDAEFSPLGAKYHEDQKTKDGIISKNIEMPDFTIIGQDLTNTIEKSVRAKYIDLTSIEDFEEQGMQDVVNELKQYEKKVQNELQAKDGKNSFTKKEIRKKMNETLESIKEHCIQNEIDKEVEKYIDSMADNKSFDSKISQDKELQDLYKKEKDILKKEHLEITSKELEHKAKVKLLYKAKEREIKKYAETSIPKFFRANLPKDENEEVMLYWYTTGESVYRFFVNRLNGLKDSNGKYVYKPQLQQKKALYKLEGLFEENEKNFYTYDKSTDSFGDLTETKNIER